MSWARNLWKCTVCGTVRERLATTRIGNDESTERRMACQCAKGKMTTHVRVELNKKGHG